jgi:hypothetical protein
MDRPDADPPPLAAEWISLDGTTHEKLNIRWEGGGWTADGVITGLDVQYAIRVDRFWKVRQFLLFRDLEEPDLWLASDGGGRWGEVNGAHRPDLDGCIDLDVLGTPFPNTLPIRRLGLHVGHAAEIQLARVDPETLDVVTIRRRYSRMSERWWRFEAVDGSHAGDVEVDDDGLVVDYPGHFQRVG